MLFSNFDFLQQNFAVISKTFLDNSDSATVSVLSHSGPARTLSGRPEKEVFSQTMLRSQKTLEMLKNEETLTNQEMKVNRKYTGKLSWVAANIRPDLCITAREMSR